MDSLTKYGKPRKASMHSASLITPARQTSGVADGALDQILPEYQFAERHSVLIRASREGVWRALHEVGDGELVVTRVLFALRDLPARIARTRAPAPERSWVAGMLASGFKLLVDTPGRELVLGTSGRFWELRPRRRPQPDPGAAVAAMDFRLEETQGGIL